MNTQAVRRYILPFAILSALLCACTDTRTSNYYMLTASAAPAPTGNHPSLGIGPIEVPQYLNRTSLVYGKEANKVTVSSYERWAEPLADGIRRVVGFNLAATLNTQSIQAYPWSREQAPDYAVRVTILLLDANTETATMTAEWRVQAGADRRLVSHRISRLSLPMTAAQVYPASIAPAYSQLLLDLSEEIASTIRADLQR